MEKKYHHEDLRTELIEEGLLMIQNEGVKNMSLRKLAKACGVSEAAPYSHFKNKDDLLKSIEEYTSNKLLQALEKAYEETKDQNVPHAIYDMGVAYVGFFIEHPSYFNFIFNQPWLKIDLSMKGMEDYKPFQFFRDKSYEVFRKAGYRDEEIKYGVINMWAKVHGVSCIASMPSVTKDFEWLDVLDKVLVD